MAACVDLRTHARKTRPVNVPIEVPHMGHRIERLTPSLNPPRRASGRGARIDVRTHASRGASWTSVYRQFTTGGYEPMASQRQRSATQRRGRRDRSTQRPGGSRGLRLPVVTNGSAGAHIHAGHLVTLRELGLNEHWLQDWLVKDLARVGLGSLVLVEQEQTQAGGGNLDILAANADTYYSIEVQLGEVDASHGFRVFDYWARNRRRFPNKTHVAVLLAESTVGRYRVALEELAMLTPLLVVELRSWRGTNEVVLVPELVIRNDSVDVSGTPLAATTGESRTEDDWRQAATKQAWQFHENFVAWTRDACGQVVVDYSPKSYIGVRVGRRVWAPLWLRQDGAQVYLPDPDLSRAEESPAYEYFRDLLADEGVTLGWQTTYNAGANPVSLRLRRSDLERPSVRALLLATYAAVLPGAVPWSERHVERSTDSEANLGPALNSSHLQASIDASVTEN
jgi:hypothetical protein